MKQGILLVSFGTTYQQAREKEIDGLARYLSRQFPDCRMYQAYTSNVVRKRLMDKENIWIPDVDGALTQMKKDGIQTVYALPSHVIDGIENHRMKKELRERTREFQGLFVAPPLLNSRQDYEETAKVLREELSEKGDGGLLLLMGHGSSHEANASYKKLEDTFQCQGKKDVYLYTVEGTPNLQDVCARLDQQNEKRVLIAPFMVVAGDHAHTDMAGKKDSAREILTQKGYQVTCYLHGMGASRGIQKIYERHLRTCMERGSWDGEDCL